MWQSIAGQHRDTAESGDGRAAGAAPCREVEAMPVTAAWARTEPAPPVRLVHLGLGAFARAHLLWYTQRANAAVPAGERWGVAGFTGRSAAVAEHLAPQGGRYTVVERSADGDRTEVIDALSEVHDGADAAAWRSLLADRRVGVLSLTVTEAGYRQRTGSRLDTEDPSVAADAALLRALVEAPSDAAGLPAATTAPGRVLDGLRARRVADAGPIAVVSCDNLPDNGAVVGAVVLELADLVDPELAAWVRQNVSFVSTMVDRITPATTGADRDAVRALTGRYDRAPVVTEPFTEWVLQGPFPAGRPAWETAGARFVDDLAPHERRKLWLLNAAHSLLAYAGPPRGARTVAEAFADAPVRTRVEALWAEARAVLPQDAAEIDAALEALRARFANARIEHRLAQIARDGSQKLPVRVLDVARARLAAGLPPGDAGAHVVADWVRHLLDADGVATDPGAAPLAAQLRRTPPAARAVAVVAALAPDLADHAPLVRAVATSLGAPALTTAR
jgi:fructuronate reductase